MDWKGLARTVAGAASRHSPAIFTALGIAGFGATVVMTAKAAPRATDIHYREMWDRDDARETAKDEAQMKELLKDSYVREFKEVAPLYLPAFGMGVISVGCFLMANKIHVDREAAVMAAYSLSEKTLATYQDKVIERLGEEAHKDILDEATKELARREVPEDLDPNVVVVPDGGGTVRCYDNVTGRYFFSSRERILEAESAINKRLLNETRVELQEFYYELGLEERFTLGEAMGWDISSPYFAADNTLNVWFTPMLDDDKNPCLALNYHVLIFERHA